MFLWLQKFISIKMFHITWILLLYHASCLRRHFNIAFWTRETTNDEIPKSCTKSRENSTGFVQNPPLGVCLLSPIIVSRTSHWRTPDQVRAVSSCALSLQHPPGLRAFALCCQTQFTLACWAHTVQFHIADSVLNSHLQPAATMYEVVSNHCEN